LRCRVGDQSDAQLHDSHGIIKYRGTRLIPGAFGYR